MTIERTLIIEMAGWIPAVIFPSATALQLFKIIRAKNADGISVITWTLFGIANICLYVYAEKYSSLQSIVGFLGTALLDFIIVWLTISLTTETVS